MYRELLSEESYNNATEYAQLLALAKAEFEEDVAKEEYEREYFNQVEPQESDNKDADKKCTYKETGCGSCKRQLDCPIEADKADRSDKV